MNLRETKFDKSITSWMAKYFKHMAQLIAVLSLFEEQSEKTTKFLSEKHMVNEIKLVVE